MEMAWISVEDRLPEEPLQTVIVSNTVHHIKRADEYPELAYNADNLVSLCDACHNRMHPEKARSANRCRL